MTGVSRIIEVMDFYKSGIPIGQQVSLLCSSRQVDGCLVVPEVNFVNKIVLHAFNIELTKKRSGSKSSAPCQIAPSHKN